MIAFKLLTYCVKMTQNILRFHPVFSMAFEMFAF